MHQNLDQSGAATNSLQKGSGSMANQGCQAPRSLWISATRKHEGSEDTLWFKLKDNADE